MFLSASCTSQQIQTLQPTVIPPIQTTPFLDFDHPRLHEIAGNKSLVIEELIRISSQGAIFVAVIVDTDDPVLRHEMLLFRIKDNVSTLVYELAPSVHMTFNIENENHPSWLLDEIPPVGLPVRISQGGNCYDCGHIVLLSLTKDGKSEDITPVTDFVPKGFIWLTGSGKAGRIELVATKYYEGRYGAEVHASAPYAFRLYAWNGSAYVDISKDEKEFYDEKTADVVKQLTKSYGEPLNAGLTMPLLSQIFFNYESSGQVEYGWEQIQIIGNLSHWDIQNTPPEEIQTYHDVFDQLEQRKNEDLATATP